MIAAGLFTAGLSGRNLRKIERPAASTGEAAGLFVVQLGSLVLCYRAIQMLGQRLVSEAATEIFRQKRVGL